MEFDNSKHITQTNCHSHTTFLPLQKKRGEKYIFPLKHNYKMHEKIILNQDPKPFFLAQTFSTQEG